MSKVQKIINYAEHSCKNHGTKLTNRRKQILTVMLHAEKAMSAYELVDYFKEEFGETLPPMSVYRILDFLQEEKLVHKLNLANKYIACAHITCDHDHGVPQFLICNNCQRVREIRIDKLIINSLKQNIEKAGYFLLSSQLEMNCLCNDCSHEGV